jgi:hypothetical protein
VDKLMQYKHSNTGHMHPLCTRPFYIGHPCAFQVPNLLYQVQYQGNWRASSKRRFISLVYPDREATSCFCIRVPYSPRIHFTYVLW